MGHTLKITNTKKFHCLSAIHILKGHPVFYLETLDNHILIWNMRCRTGGQWVIFTLSLAGLLPRLSNWTTALSLFLTGSWFFLKFLFYFLPHLAACRILAPWQGIKLLCLHWEHGVQWLNTGPPGKSLLILLHNIVILALCYPCLGMGILYPSKVPWVSPCHLLPGLPDAFIWWERLGARSTQREGRTGSEGRCVSGIPPVSLHLCKLVFHVSEP